MLCDIQARFDHDVASLGVVIEDLRPEVVMSFTGHRSFKTMKKYIALTENIRAEAMHRVWGE